MKDMKDPAAEFGTLLKQCVTPDGLGSIVLAVDTTSVKPDRQILKVSALWLARHSATEARFTVDELPEAVTTYTGIAKEHLPEQSETDEAKSIVYQLVTAERIIGHALVFTLQSLASIEGVCDDFPAFMEGIKALTDKKAAIADLTHGFPKLVDIGMLAKLATCTDDRFKAYGDALDSWTTVQALNRKSGGGAKWNFEICCEMAGLATPVRPYDCSTKVKLISDIIARTGLGKPSLNLVGR